MSELKHQLMLNKDMSWVPCYLKSEADKVIAHSNYKRCLAMARWCKLEIRYADYLGVQRRYLFAWKWHKRWLELAEKFKEMK